MADENEINSSETGYPNYGLSVPASIAVNTVVTGQFTIVEMSGARTIGRLGGPVTTVAIGSVDVVDAYLHGTTNDVITQTAGIGGAIGGGFLAGAGAGATLGAFGATPFTVGVGTVAGGVVGAYYGEEWVQSNVDGWLNSEPVPTAPHDFLPGVSSNASITTHYNPYTGSVSYEYDYSVGTAVLDGSSSTVRVRTSVYTDPETGAQIPITSTVPLYNPATGTRSDLLRGNVYDPNNIGVGQELNGLDRIARENSIAGQTYGPPAPSGGNSSSGGTYSFGDGDSSNDNDWRRPERDDNNDGPVGGNTRGVSHGSGGGANSTVGRGSGGTGREENHSVPW